MSNNGYSSDDYIRDSAGNPLRDRYGRPIRKRNSSQSPQPRREQSFPDEGRHQRSRQANPQAPRQYFPPQDAGSPQRPYRDAPPQQYSQPQRYPRQTAPRTVAPRPQAQRAPVGQHYRPAPPAQPPQRSSARRMRPRRRLGCLGMFAWALALILVLSVASLLFMDSKLNRIDATPAESIPNTKGTNWLLVGSDSRTGFSEDDANRLGTGGDIGSMRTDTIMILHLPSFGGKATLVSLPRDSYVSIPGYGEDKINAAYAYGGAPLLVQTVEQATGLHMDHYAEIGMGGLANVVDAVGGIEVCPDEPIDDPLANINIPAGCQELSGPDALGYVRTRATSEGDLDRVARQREFLNAIAKKAKSPGTLLNPFRMLSLMNKGPAALTVGQNDHIWHFARLGLALGSGLETTTVPVGGFASYDVGDVVLWDDAGAQELFNSLR